jgi:hypothetical protein
MAWPVTATWINPSSGRLCTLPGCTRPATVLVNRTGNKLHLCDEDVLAKYPAVLDIVTPIGGH